MFRTWNLFRTIAKYNLFDDFWHKKIFGTFGTWENVNKNFLRHRRKKSENHQKWWWPPLSYLKFRREVSLNII